jgi:hypothetical protein
LDVAIRFLHFFCIGIVDLADSFFMKFLRNMIIIIVKDFFVFYFCLEVLAEGIRTYKNFTEPNDWKFKSIVVVSLQIKNNKNLYESEMD